MNNYSFFYKNNVKKYFKFLQKKMQNMIINNLQIKTKIHY